MLCRRMASIEIEADPLSCHLPAWASNRAEPPALLPLEQRPFKLFPASIDQTGDNALATMSCIEKTTIVHDIGEVRPKIENTA